VTGFSESNAKDQQVAADQCTGYAIGNFGIGGEITPTGRIFSRILYNPPVLGPWLEHLGRGQFTFRVDGKSVKDEDFESVAVNRVFPTAAAAYKDSRLGIAVNASFFAPLAAEDAFVSSIPAACVEFEITNASDAPKQASVEFSFDSESEWANSRHLAGGSNLWVMTV